MKTKILLALRELLIYLIIIVALVLIAFMSLRDYYPIQSVQEASKYAVLDRANYTVVGDVEKAKNPTVVYDTKAPIIETDQTELRYIPGSINPFVAEQGGSDVPSDTINVTYVKTSSNMQKKTQTTAQQTSDNSEEDTSEESVEE